MVAELKTQSNWKREVGEGKRFAFGENWRQFLALLDEKRICTAEQSLQEMLNVEHLHGKRFLDIGSGSGLFSLAARRLGASVHSFDYDPRAVACTAELRERYFPNDEAWTIAEGSILDTAFVSSLGTFDIVYSWGVLHHTGAMWQALEHVHPLVAPSGQLFIALYNDQGATSRNWKIVKRIYNMLPPNLKFLILWPTFISIWCPMFLRDILHGRPFATWLNYKAQRGMSPWRDVIDWVGGYPFEVATPGDVFEFYRQRGLNLVKLKSSNAYGCNEYVFVKE